MPVPCYTCSEEIVFDKEIAISKTGKPIPLWPDKKNTHSHDEEGRPTRGPLPTANLSPQQTQQFNQYNRRRYPEPPQQERFQEIASKTAQIGSGEQQQSRGGSYLDTKRIRVMLEEIAKEIQEIKIMLNEILNARTILDTNRYEGKNDQIYNVMKPFLTTQGVAASELLKDKQRDPMSLNHGKIADLNELTGVTDDDDSDDDIEDDDDNNNNDDNKGVIKEEEDEDL